MMMESIPARPSRCPSIRPAAPAPTIPTCVRITATSRSEYTIPGGRVLFRLKEDARTGDGSPSERGDVSEIARRAVENDQCARGRGPRVSGSRWVAAYDRIVPHADCARSKRAVAHQE